jgi:hypothetical protein
MKLLCAILLGVGVVLGCKGNGTSTGNSSGNVKNNDFAMLRAIKDKSLAILENAAESDQDGRQLNEAAEGFRTLAKTRPDDALGLQNLCVTLYSRVKVTDPSEADGKNKALCQEFESSIAALRKLRPQEPVADVLQSRYCQWRNDREGAVQALTRATQVSNATPDTFFQLAQLHLADGPASMMQDVKALLESAIRLAPKNLALAVAYLDVLAKTKDAKFGTQLDRCKELCVPVTSRTSSPVTALIEKASVAFTKDDWRTAQTQASFLKNVLLAEVSFQNDLHLLDPHVLDFVQLEFESPLANQASKDIRSRKQEFIPGSRWAFASAGISAIGSEDMDLDGNMDLVLVGNSNLEVWSLQPKNEAEKIMTLPIEGAFEGVALVDLDHDYQILAFDSSA